MSYVASCLLLKIDCHHFKQFAKFKLIIHINMSYVISCLLLKIDYYHLLIIRINISLPFSIFRTNIESVFRYDDLRNKLMLSPSWHIYHFFNLILKSPTTSQIKNLIYNIDER